LLQKQNKHLPGPSKALAACAEIGLVTGLHGMRTIPANEANLKIHLP